MLFLYLVASVVWFFMALVLAMIGFFGWGQAFLLLRNKLKPGVIMITTAPPGDVPVVGDTPV